MLKLQNKNTSYIFENCVDPKITIWKIIVIVFITLFFIIGNLYKYDQYLSYYGQVIIEGEDIHVQIYMENDKIHFIQNDTVTINGQKFEIVKIESENYSENNKIYKSIIIKYNIEEKLIIENNTIKIIFKLPQTTIIKQIKKRGWLYV